MTSLPLLKKRNPKTFECKSRTKSLPFQFYGFWVDKHESGGYILHQKDYCSNLREIDSSASSKSAGRGKIAYASTSTRPDTSSENVHLSQVTAEVIDKKACQS